MSQGRVVLIGAVHESIAAFEAIRDSSEGQFAGVVTLTEEAGRSVSGSVDLAELAIAYGIPVVRVSNVNAPESVSAIRELAPDLIAVVGWTRLIGDELLALPPCGVVGFHASMLPRNRGRAPVNWAIIRGETSTGNSMMLLDAGVDTGAIVDQRSTPIYADDTCATVYERVAELGAEMLSANLGRLLDRAVVAKPQSGEGSNHLPKRIPAMGVTDWRRDPVAVHDWIRAQTAPYPGAFTTISGSKLTLWESAIPTLNHHAGQPGEILAVEGTGLRVGAGAGSVLIATVSCDGGPKQTAAAWFDEAGLPIGSQFDIPDDATSDWSLGLGERPAGELVDL